MTTNTVPRLHSKKNAFAPLIMDVAVPIGSYYLFKDGLGTSTLTALGLSSVLPAVRTVWSAVRERTVNAFATLILFVNLVGLLLSFVAGDPRLMLAKDSGVSSAIGIGILVSVALGKPMMTAGMRPWIVKGDAQREAAWERLLVGSPAFRRAERVFSVVWGVVLLGECVVRVVGAYTLPVDTMVWLGSVIMAVAMALGFFVGGALAAGPMARMLAAEVQAGARTFTVEAESGETRTAAPAPALAR
ncbi:VC0807 family protein [Streptomyces sp. NPDC046931]|uniref:VC0807 family protein n=1 Tax=Streptomyces sp. NPDC046931 TaxID=3154806 RepID=UPI0033FC1D30